MSDPDEMSALRWRVDPTFAIFHLSFLDSWNEIAETCRHPPVLLYP